jgi:hypothetical protein
MPVPDPLTDHTNMPELNAAEISQHCTNVADARLGALVLYIHPGLRSERQPRGLSALGYS